MRQKRSLTGIKFEKEICEKLGWLHKSKSPRIGWEGSGRTNLEKLSNHFKNGTDMLVSLSKSSFDKFDAIDNNGNKIEIKKYQSSQCLDWTLYSEPLVKIASNKNIEIISELLGDGDEQLGRSNYNKFIKKAFDKNKKILLKNIISSNDGIRFKDKYVSKENLQFRMIIIKESWRGYDRATIQFRVVDKTKDKPLNEVIETVDEKKKEQKTFFSWLIGLFK